MKKLNIKDICIIACLLTISIVISIIEGILFPIPIVGVKLGLANIVTLILLFKYSKILTFTVVLLRILIVSFLIGTFLGPTFYMSLSGGLLALFVMMIIKKINVFSIFGISICGAVAHSIGQILATFILLETFLTIYYLPLILFASLFSGVFTAFVARKVLDIM